MVAFEREFDTVRQYARYGIKNIFVPFLWGKQTEINIEIYLCRVDSKKKGRFYFAITLLPGSVYFIQLNRVDEDDALKIIAEKYKLEIFDKKCFIKREAPKIYLTTKENDRGRKMRKTNRKKDLNYKEIMSLLKRHHDILSKYKVKRIGLFGSYARGEQKKHSDIDFLIELEEPNFDNFMDLAFSLENLFRKKVELVTNGSLSPYIQPHVEKEVRWYEA